MLRQLQHGLLVHLVEVHEYVDFRYMIKTAIETQFNLDKRS